VDKKPLIGVSIIIVVLLVLGSLSNVVGYQSVKSTVNDSPLFQTRTQRATNQQQNSITCQYLGKGLETHLKFLARDNKTELMKKAIRILNKMTDKELDQLHKNIILFNCQKKVDKIVFDKSIKLLSLLKSNNVDLQNYLINFNENRKNDPPTVTGCVTEIGAFKCMIGFAIFIFIFFIVTIFALLLQLFTIQDCTTDLCILS